MFQSIPPEEYIPKDSNDVGASVKLFNHYGETFAQVDKGGNTMALMRLMDSTASIYKDIALVIFCLFYFCLKYICHCTIFHIIHSWRGLLDITLCDKVCQ